MRKVQARRADMSGCDARVRIGRLVSLFCLLSAICIPLAHAQEVRAITESGRRVILMPDGRWKYDARVPAPILAQAEQSPYQPVVRKFSVAFDTSKWVSVPKKNPDDEFNKKMFRHKTLPIFGVVISDELPATTENIRNLILMNAKAPSGVDPVIVLDESRTVGGKTVGAMRFILNIGGVDFMFSNNYYGDNDGNIQIVCYTGQAVFHKYETDCQQFIGGLTIR